MFLIVAIGTWIQLLVPKCIQDSVSQQRIIWPHILTLLKLRSPAAQNHSEFCREVGFHFSCGSLWHIFCWTFSGSSGHTFFVFFAFAFCHAKVETSYFLLLYSFPDILVWFPARGEANAWTQLPPWTSNPIILTLFKSLWCLQYDSICYSLLSELLETLPKVLAIRVMYWIGLLLNKESLKYFNAKKMEVYFSPVWQVWHQGGIIPCCYPDTQASSFLLVCHSPSVVFKQKEKDLEETISVLRDGGREALLCSIFLKIVMHGMYV